MRSTFLFLMTAVMTMALIFFLGGAAWADSLALAENWRLVSSADIQAAGAELSTPGFDDDAWYPVTVPTTVLAALVDNKVYPDPYYGLNLKSIPGFVEGRWLRMPEDSPFYPPWWYRTEFTAPEDFVDKFVTLNLDGINYRANVWLNGKLVASEDQLVGMFRRFELDVNGLIKPGQKNALAIEIIAPGKLPDKRYTTKQVEATTGWDDHNPQPPDLNMGIWEDVYLKTTGPVRVKHPYVSADLDLPGLERARLTVSAFLQNMSNQTRTATLAGAIEDREFSQEVTLAAGEMKQVIFHPADHAVLVIDNPRVWWPHPVGPQELYYLDLAARVDGQASDQSRTRFGIRETTTYINDEGWRGYRINGKNILIRGGAWMTADMLLRLDQRRYRALVRYAREANFNMLRSEGFSIRETDEFYDLCDEMGIMVTQQIFGRSIPDEQLAIDSVKDMMLRIRNHPSLVHFLGHDETFPTATLDAAYRELIAEYTPERSYQPHSGAFMVRDRFKTGGTRTGTIELWTYAGPAQYYLHKGDGAWGFAQSGGIGGVVAQEESIRRMLPEDQLWPLWNESWSFHTVIQGGAYYDKLLKAMNQRYGEPKDFVDFVKTAHVMNYESARGMYEAYARNKYDALGITTWKYDAAWPAALTWQYIDWYLLPTGAYYGAKKACEPLHVQYSYDDNSVYVVNSFYTPFYGLTTRAAVYDLDMNKVAERKASVDVGPDGKTEAFVLDFDKRKLTRTFFLHLELLDELGQQVTDNFYWLSTKRDRPGEKFYGMVPLTPSSYPDLSGIRELAPVRLETACGLSEERDERIVKVTLTNPTDRLAFFVQLAVVKSDDGMEVAPSYWSENYFSALPGQTRVVNVAYDKNDLNGQKPVIRIQGWNIKETMCEP